MLVFVYVQFPAQAYDANGQPFSYEPRKWYRILHHSNVVYPQFDKTGLRPNIHGCWLSEYGQSLNLMVHTEGMRREDLEALCRELKRAFTGAEVVGVPRDVIINPPRSAWVGIERRLRKAA